MWQITVIFKTGRFVFPKPINGLTTAWHVACAFKNAGSVFMERI